MDTIVGEFYLEDCIIKKSSQTDYSYNIKTYQFYEVIRSTEGVLLFLEDHLERLNVSLVNRGISILNDEVSIQTCLKKLVSFNTNHTGNVKLLCRIEDEKLFFTAYYVPHIYPTNEQFSKGIKLVTFKIERPDPNCKQVHVSESIREEIKNSIPNSMAYEILLVDNNNCVTEGSKSNILFIKNEKLFSPPDQTILQGITRKYALLIAKNHGIEVIKRPIQYSDVNHFESAFICGTSNKILPVNYINNNKLQIDNSIIKLIKQEYENIIQNYLRLNKNKKE